MADSKKYTSPVPTDYQEVEYIQSSGNGEYIDTGYIPTVNTRFNIDFQFIEAMTPYYDSIPVMGERLGATPNSKLALWVNKTSYKEALNFGSYDSGFNTSDITNANVRNVTSNVRANMYYNGAFVRGDDNVEFTTGDLSIYLFALNSNGTLDNRNCIVKLYSYKLYENDVLVRDFVPVYRKSDNVAGLYDTINDVFYTNQGAGSFSVGANISPWQHSLRKLGTATETIQSGDTIYADGTAATVSLKGNTTQSGTPSPSNPVDVVGVGVRTENLAHNWFANSTTSRYSSILFSAADLKPNTTYVIMFDVENVYNFYSNENVFTSAVYINTVAGTNYIVVTTKSNIDVSVSGQGLNGRWIIFKNGREQSVSVAMTNVMIVEGDTPPTSFIPYGYKIPISLANTTTPVYLGEVQSTRRIKKLVLTGDESFIVRSGEPSNVFFYEVSNTNFINNQAICSHYINQNSGSFNALEDKHCLVTSTSDGVRSFIGIRDSTFPQTNDGAKQLRSWLSAQYANGTPVTVWYVLATPETATVNEPLMKIGDYADTLSNATSIPTTEGANSITVDTTVQPSEVTATWTGWHDASVKEKSENLFDTFDIVGQVPSISNGQLITYNGSTTSLMPIISGNITVTKPPTALLYLLLYAADMSYIGYVQNSTDANFYGSSVTGYENAKYCRLRIDRTSGLDDIQIMLNAGSTALPYEPYWK